MRIKIAYDPLRLGYRPFVAAQARKRNRSKASILNSAHTNCDHHNHHRRAISGRFTQVRKARDLTRLSRAYAGLYDVIEMSKNLSVLPFSPAAVELYGRLRKSLPRTGKQDLAIASIVLEFGAVVVTRNRRDFEIVTALRVEDWTLPN